MKQTPIESDSIQKLLTFAETHYSNISHPLYVSKDFDKGSDEWIVALLHDILEDTAIDVTQFSILLENVDKSHLIQPLIAITRTDDETYAEYIERCKQNPIARQVKEKDIGHHLYRKETLKPSLKVRYEKAIDQLTK